MSSKNWVAAATAKNKGSSSSAAKPAGTNAAAKPSKRARLTDALMAMRNKK